MGVIFKYPHDAVKNCFQLNSDLVLVYNLVIKVRQYNELSSLEILPPAEIAIIGNLQEIVIGTISQIIDQTSHD